MKILLIQFKLLGDSVFITPSIQALKEKYPLSKIHILVRKECGPIFEHLPQIDKIWVMPNIKDKFRLLKTILTLINLALERFEYSLDFVGNDRGSIASILSFSKEKFSIVKEKPNLLNKIAYSKTVNTKNLPMPWTNKYLLATSFFFGRQSKLFKMKIYSDLSLKKKAAKLLGRNKIIFHIGASQEKKQIPIYLWYELYLICKHNRLNILFSSGPSKLEQSLLKQLVSIDPKIPYLKSTDDLNLFLAVLNEADLVVASDTGPLHISAALGVKVIGIFATLNSIRCASGIYLPREKIIIRGCSCKGAIENLNVCQNNFPCINELPIHKLFLLIKKRLEEVNK